MVFSKVPLEMKNGSRKEAVEDKIEATAPKIEFICVCVCVCVCVCSAGK